MQDKITWVPFDQMEAFMVEVFKGIGVPEDDARVCADVLITADKRGIDSHGTNRLKPIYYDRIKLGIQEPLTQFEIIRETPGTAVVDGHNGMGMVVSKRAMQMAIDKARNVGLGMVAVRNSTHYGIAGYYALMATDAGMIGITGTNARPSVPPTFGVENMLGTNPITFGLPTDEAFPFVLDCATSITQRGKIEVYARTGKPVPEGLVIGSDGRILTDAQEVLDALIQGKGALLPLGGAGEDTGGYKGYGYSTVVEILSAALQGGSFLKMLSGFDANGKRIPYPLGHFFIAINIEAFTALDAFKKTSGEILRALRNSKKAPGAERIYTAGEKEHLAWLERQNKGVPVNQSLRKDILAMQAELGLQPIEFPDET
jgi:LDH2 family malate/lactate/ureidoglycolate dehydrogenase